MIRRNAIYKHYIETIEHFAWFPIRLTNNKIIWLCTYYEELYLFSAGFGFARLCSSYMTRDEYIIKKLSGS